jgi:hypothetical protein
MGGVSGEMDGEGVRGGRGILTGSLLFISLLFEATDAIESRGGACQVLQVILGIQEDGME